MKNSFVIYNVYAHPEVTSIMVMYSPHAVRTVKVFRCSKYINKFTSRVVLAPKGELLCHATLHEILTRRDADKRLENSPSFTNFFFRLIRNGIQFPVRNLIFRLP